MSIRLCLFDLDNTLLRTDDLEVFRGRENVNRTSRDYTRALLREYRSRDDRLLYTPEQLEHLQEEFPRMCWGVFTRAPRHYASTLLDEAYPQMEWDILVAYEDVRNTKPNPEGIELAARRLGVRRRDQVVLVGDEKVDVVCAYRAGCWVFIDQATWQPRENVHWWALERVPDALFEGASELEDLLASPYLGVPELEYLINGERLLGRQRRIDRVNHFFPRSAGGGYVPIHVMGRLFGEHEEIRYRRETHVLTDQIIAHKDADEFPDEWIEAIQRFVRSDKHRNLDTVVTVVPFKPGRPPRLEGLLDQVASAYQARYLSADDAAPNVSFCADVLAFRVGAVSSHGNHLNAHERFANVGDNLHIRRPRKIQGKHVIVIDDVVTTGATLLWSHRYLREAGARSVSCLSLAQAVGAN
ncbi:HAD-IA family hydrolase [Stenotrophomonas maltophilia]|uniref:HAD-IA family hydrolase n=1 Tax=Stenotrophomonas maltophilia TaxID=40324 RepID=UPI0039F67FBE